MAETLWIHNGDALLEEASTQVNREGHDVAITGSVEQGMRYSNPYSAVVVALPYRGETGNSQIDQLDRGSLEHTEAVIDFLRQRDAPLLGALVHPSLRPVKRRLKQAGLHDCFEDGDALAKKVLALSD